MTLRLQSTLTAVDNISDPQIESAFEVVMPTLKIGELSASTKSTLANLSFGNVLSELAGKDYTPIVEKITFGTLSFGSADRRVRTGWLNVPDDIKNYPEVSITMYCSNGMLTQYYLESWKRLVFNPDGEYYNQANVYKRNIEVYFYGTGNVGAGMPLAAHYTLVGCFPTQQENYTLQYSGAPKRLVLTQKFRMDKIIYDMSLMKSSIIEELAGAPLTIADRAISSLSDAPSTYTLNKTY